MSEPTCDVCNSMHYDTGYDLWRCEHKEVTAEEWLLNAPEADAERSR